MGVRQLEEFLGQADQKGFWIFTYANLAGGFVGAFAGNALAEKLAPDAPAFKLLGIMLGILTGVMTTWKIKGHAVYSWSLLSIAFFLRRYARVGLGDVQINAGTYYRAGASRQEPFMLVTTREGRTVPVLLHRGAGSGFDFGLSYSDLTPSANATLDPATRNVTHKSTLFETSMSGASAYTTTRPPDATSLALVQRLRDAASEVQLATHVAQQEPKQPSVSQRPARAEDARQVGEVGEVGRQDRDREIWGL